ncbi:hypothetical protein DFS33DRAFT_1363862 [Desarmillaria ectypa]|nr:hypothetical protein DFS33DRAFT_1363862 [Desarmillaria ectypa]
MSPVWAMMRMYGIQTEALNDTGIHRLDNILTLCCDLYDAFDQLILWLQATKDQPNTYVAETVSLGVSRSLPSRVVTFASPDPEALPLPSPAYLAIHAACCRIAHMSGAAGYAEKVLRDEEETREQIQRMGILAEDGSSMDIFNRYMAAAV